MATTIKIKTLKEGYQSIITNGKHSIVGDEPVSSKGTDLGMSPPELVLAGIGMCKTATVRNVARRKGWDIGIVEGSFTQKVRKTENGLEPFITVEISIEGDLTDEQRNHLLHEADHCYVHRLIDNNWNIETAIKEEALESVF